MLFLVFLISPTFANEGESQSQKVAYQGPIYNIFFHPIIAYPKLAFDQKNNRLKYMNNWFVTQREFNNIIPQLYKQGFILVSPKDLFEEQKNDQGNLTIARKTIFLPTGKKPLILSLDDYNFYTTMKLHGTIHRFWVDSSNELATITNLKEYQTIIRYDQEIPQLLEKFIKAHPDFSFNRARGIISLTGFNGIFGYNTHQPLAPDYNAQLKEAKKVVLKLKQMGWEFGSHSYFHRSSDNQSLREFKESEKCWLQEVGSLIGPSSYYIFPFGEAWNKDQMRMEFLKSIGFKYFFGVSSSTNITVTPGAVMMYRFPIDGLSLMNHYNYGKPFIFFTHVLDVDRPLKRR